MNWYSVSKSQEEGFILLRKELSASELWTCDHLTQIFFDLQPYLHNTVSLSSSERKSGRGWKKTKKQKTKLSFFLQSAASANFPFAFLSHFLKPIFLYFNRRSFVSSGHYNGKPEKLLRQNKIQAHQETRFEFYMKWSFCPSAMLIKPSNVCCVKRRARDRSRAVFT